MKKQSVETIARSLAYGDSALSVDGLNRYVAEQERVLSVSKNAKVRVRTAYYLKAGKLALTLRAGWEGK